MTDLSDWVGERAETTPDRTAIHFEGEDISYRGFRDRVLGVAAMLHGTLGIARGDRVAFLGYNSPEMLVLLFACARLGAMLVPVNWRLAGPEILYILRHSDAAVSFVEPDFEATVRPIRDFVPDCRMVRFGGAADGMEDFDALVEGAAGPDRVDGVGDDDPVLIVYTSGTTGRPKGAVLTQAALAANAENSIAVHRMTAADVVLTNLPMFHVGGLNIQTTPAFRAGATVVLQRRFEPDATVAAIREFRPTLLILVPALMKALIDHPDWAALDLSALRCIDTGSTTVPLPLLGRYLDRGVPVIQVYGLTETAPIAIHQEIETAFETAGSIGGPARLCEAGIRDAEGRDLPDGERGEIVVRGPNVMVGYWRDPEATAQVLDGEGWFRTGDVGHRDANGHYYVDDRTKDVVISGSENIYPAEVELVLDECPEIAEAAVVGRPDAKWGEVPVACVVRRPGSAITRDDVLELYRGRLARYKHPRDVVFMDALPRNVMGKILKYELRDWVRAPAQSS